MLNKIFSFGLGIIIGIASLFASFFIALPFDSFIDERTPVWLYTIIQFALGLLFSLFVARSQGMFHEMVGKNKIWFWLSFLIAIGFIYLVMAGFKNLPL